ncbi:MAG: DUF262 domain-containing protein [Byssovorax sp.]
MELLAGEKVEIVDAPAVPVAKTDEELVRRYAAGEMRILTEHARYPLQAIPTMLKDNARYKLDPSLPAAPPVELRVVKASRLIESFIMNVPVPPVFSYEYDLARVRREVSDGQQRLPTIRDFYAGDITLSGLVYWPELNGRTYGTLPQYIRDGIDRWISVVDRPYEASSARRPRKRLVSSNLSSSASTAAACAWKLKSSAMRQSRPFNELCKELATNKTFVAMWTANSDEPPVESGRCADLGQFYEYDDGCRTRTSVFRLPADPERRGPGVG